MNPVKDFDDMIARLKSRDTTSKLAVAAAEDPSVLEAVKLAEDDGIIEAVLFGARDEVTKAAATVGYDVSPSQIVDAPDHGEAARLAVAAVNEGRADMVMKGLLHTDVLFKAVLDKAQGLQTGQRVCHVCIVQADALGRLLFASDAALNILPDLRDKAAILSTAVGVARAFGVDRPKVAALSAVETIKEAMPSTVHGACLAKMGERGQLGCDCVVDGPLAFDIAVSVEAARHKGVSGPVAGKAEVLVLPNIETGNILWKAFVHLAGGKIAGLVAGARAPLVVTSRSDSAQVKYLSIAAAAYVVQAK